VHDGGLACEHMAAGGTHVEGQSTVYQRLWNPTVARFEEGVAVLEDAPEAVPLKVAAALAEHGLVQRVYYPGLPECDPQQLIGTQISGPGSLVAFELAGAEHAERIPSAVGWITHAASLGGIDTLIQHPAGLTHRPVAADAKPNASLLRMSVGLEDPSDIVADLVQANEATR
jgi:cystathionine gamma-synthase/methionine-gamma-lyase